MWSHLPGAAINKILQNDQFKKPKREQSDGGRCGNCSVEKVATVLNTKYRNKLLVRKRLQGIMLTPQGNEGKQRRDSQVRRHKETHMLTKP